MLFSGVLVLAAAFGMAAAKYCLDRSRYLRRARRFAEKHGLGVEIVWLAGADVALAGRLDGHALRTSIVRMRIDAPTTEAVGYCFETYCIEVSINRRQQWLVLMRFEHHDMERVERPALPRYRSQYSTASKDFDRRYHLSAETKPSHSFFGDSLRLGELMDAKLRAAHANGGTLRAYFERPMLWKYSSFARVENLIRLTLRMAAAAEAGVTQGP